MWALGLTPQMPIDKADLGMASRPSATGYASAENAAITTSRFAPQFDGMAVAHLAERCVLVGIYGL